MKLIFAEEDSVYGILIGLLVVGLSRKYFTVPDLPILWGAAFCISLIFTFLDLTHSFSRMSRHMLIVIAHWLTNAVDFVLEVSFISLFFHFNLPFISNFMMPYLGRPEYLFIFGAYFVISNIFWVVVFPFAGE